MWGNTIASRVSRVIKQRVRDAQKEHDETCKELDAQCEEQKKVAEQRRDDHKEAHALEMVSRIIGK